MRFSLILIFIISSTLPGVASVDDTLPSGVSSRFLVFPFFLRSPETSWGFGGAGAFFFKAKKDDDKIRTSDINLVGLYTLKKQTVAVLGSTIFFPNEDKIFRLQSSYSYYPDKFWGLGNKSEESAQQEYSIKQFFINPVFLFRLYNKLYIGASYELQDVTDFTYKSGSIFDSQNVNGRYGGFTSGAGVVFTWDSRNNAYSPSRGALAEFNITRYSSLLKSDFDFTSYTVDVRKFIPFGRNRVFASQVFTRLNIGHTPVRYLCMLGGTEIMRGYYKGRYTDQNMIALQAEVRQYLFWRLGVVGFTSIGQVSEAMKSFSIYDFHHTYGGGLRIMLHEKEKLNLRIDFGFGKGSSGVYVVLKEAF